MKLSLIIILFLVTNLNNAQVVFTSPITQHFPSGDLELINRTITFTGNEFLIESETVVKTLHAQKWIVKKHSEMEFPLHGLSHFYVCESVDGMYQTYILIPAVDEIEYIEVVQPKQLTIEPRHYRFLID